LYCNDLNERNFYYELPTINKFIAGLSYYNNVSEQNDAINNLTTRMDFLFSTDTMINHDAGNLIQTGLSSGINFTKIDLRWTNPLPNSSYFSSFMDLLTEEIYPLTGQTSDQPGVHFSLPGTTEGYLFTLNARSSNGQGSYDIIIVDKDINFHSLASGGNSYIGNGNSSRASLQKEVDHFSQLKLFPNPVDDSHFQINFHLSENENTSIKLIEASSGKLVKTILTTQTLSKGEHSISVENELAGGIYFIVLQTDTCRSVEKLVKIN